MLEDENDIMSKRFVAAIAFFSALSGPAGADGLNVGFDAEQFRAWSNSRPEEQALIELSGFLEGLAGPAGVIEWFEAVGFRRDITTPRKLSGTGIDILGYPKGEYYSLGMAWDDERNGPIFTYGIVNWLDGWLVVYGFGVWIEYRYDVATPEAPIQIMKIQISKSRL